MSETKTIWAVTTGDYSSYRVVGVYSSYENALKIAEHCGLGANNVEEWELDPGVENVNAGLSVYLIAMLRDGSVKDCSRLVGTVEAREPLYITYASYSKRREFYLYGSVWAKDEAHAIKIANERRAQLIAEDKWPLPDGEYIINMETGELTPC